MGSTELPGGKRSRPAARAWAARLGPGSRRGAALVARRRPLVLAESGPGGQPWARMHVQAAMSTCYPCT